MSTVIDPRLPPHTFRLPVEKLRAGYKSDIYFQRAKLILEEDGERTPVTMQLFQKHPRVTVVGIDQVLAMLYVAAGHYRDAAKADTLFLRYLELEKELYRAWLAHPRIEWGEYERLARDTFGVSHDLAELWVPGHGDLAVRALHDGETAEPWEPVMHIEGPYHLFAHLETLYLGALAESTKVATQTREVVAAAAAGGMSKPVLMFGARHMAHELQAGAGYAAYIGGASGVSTNESGEWWGSRAVGTIPHALIAAYGGNTTLATLRFEERINHPRTAIPHLTAQPGGPTVNLSPLVDFDNDAITTSLQVAGALGRGLWGVRVDTSEMLVDQGVLRDAISRSGEAGKDNNGVTPRLVQLLRRALDEAGHEHVRIVASGGFGAEKIRRFEAAGVPVDVYGVGSSLVHGSGYDYTADIVRLNGRACAKIGRAYRPNGRLAPVDWNALVRTDEPAPV